MWSVDIMSVVFSPPPSTFFKATAVIIVLATVFIGLSEARGSHVIKYSRFFNTNSSARSSGARVYTRTGMLAFYTPSFLIAAASFWIFPAAGDNLRFFLIRAALTLHFLKRILEVMFVHKYSGLMAVDTMCFTSVMYALFTVITIYIHFISLHLPEPGINLIYPGVALFLIGLAGNFYHHLILARLRDNRGDKEYAIPHGGLFNLVLCPHYLFEIIDFIGLSLISQTTCCAAFVVASMFYLMGRSYATRRWYLSKFDDFPPRHVLFVHKFSGFMGSTSMCIISLNYFLLAVNSIYVQYLSRDLPEPSVGLMYPGLLLFLIGIAGNLYHHIILSRLRNAGGVKEYKIPQGGLFGLVTCPHYLFEVIDFIGLAFISQTAYSFPSVLGTIAYLMGRSYATRRWYVSKFEDYPRRIKAIFPFIF